MGRSTVAAFKAAAEAKGAKTVGEVFAPLDNKDYSPFFGQMRSPRPAVLYTSVAGNDTVRLFTQMAEFGVNRNVQVVGASGTVTSQNLAAIGKAAEGFVTGVGYSPDIDSAGEQEVRRRLRGRGQGRARPVRRRFLRRAVSSTRPRWRRPRAPTPTSCATAMRGLQWATPQGMKTHARRRPPGDAGHVRGAASTNGKFKIVGKVGGRRRPIGPDTCTKF